MLDGPSSTEHACLLLVQFLSVARCPGASQSGVQVSPGPGGDWSMVGGAARGARQGFKFNGKILAVAGQCGQGQLFQIAGAWDPKSRVFK